MKEILTKKLANLTSANEKYNFLREFLQELILQILDRQGYFKYLAFVGGTALRVLYDLPRFSEDLDFSLIEKDKFDFNQMIEVLKRELELSGFGVEVSKGGKQTVLGKFIKFKNILFELGLTSHHNEKLFIKLEIDSNPPSGYHTEVSLINKNFLFKVRHYDQPSLFASKLHALLFRKYMKGRDYYDLLWFLTRKVEINYKLLSTAAEQTEKRPFNIDLALLKKMLIEKINKVDFKHIQKDLAPFLADEKENEYLKQEYFVKAIERAI